MPLAAETPLKEGELIDCQVFVQQSARGTGKGDCVVELSSASFSEPLA